MALHPGLTVVTGETGAGKTMIVSGLDLLLGGRADPKTVRAGAERARVEGRFTELGNGYPGPVPLTDQVGELGGVLEDNELLVARHVTSDRTLPRLRRWRPGPANGCAEIVRSWSRSTGSPEQLRLADRNRQREMLDRFAGPEQSARLATYRHRYAEHRDAQSELARLTDQERPGRGRSTCSRSGCRRSNESPHSPARTSAWRRRRDGCSRPMTCGRVGSGRDRRRWPGTTTRPAGRWPRSRRRGRRQNGWRTLIRRLARWPIGWSRRATCSPT